MSESVRRPVIIGEVLFDRFPDGSEVLGGAPFNVAWHLQGFGSEPRFVSRVGSDRQGERIRDAMQAWGMDIHALGVDTEHPTGAVQVTLDAGQPSYEILPDQAYDQLEREDMERGLAGATVGAVYHGTLMLRGPRLRDALARTLREHPLPVFCDVNLRDPWWHSEVLPPLLARARWVKMNDVELDIIAKSLQLSETDLHTRAERLRVSHDIEWLIVTRGGEGAVAFGPRGEVADVKPQGDLEIVDTVGAGDAFAATVLHGLLRNWPMQTSLERAQAFASRICGIRGATTDDRELYETMRATWETD